MRPVAWIDPVKDIALQLGRTCRASCGNPSVERETHQHAQITNLNFRTTISGKGEVTKVVGSTISYLTTSKSAAYRKSSSTRLTTETFFRVNMSMVQCDMSRNSEKSGTTLTKSPSSVGRLAPRKEIGKSYYEDRKKCRAGERKWLKRDHEFYPPDEALATTPQR
jgi:hypothetical protein